MDEVMSQPRNKTHKMLQSMQRLPGGLTLFSWAVCFIAPYFGSIKPRFIELKPGLARARIRKRRRVHNHLKTVHAIAMANLCEYVGGTLMEVSISSEMRWIPKAMTIRYLARATTDITASCEISDYEWSTKQEVTLEVKVHDNAGILVAEAEIPMYVSPRPHRATVTGIVG
jgi:acyl-coenzyme A thioesterase PaaI-like protein